MTLLYFLNALWELATGGLWFEVTGHVLLRCYPKEIQWRARHGGVSVLSPQHSKARRIVGAVKAEISSRPDRVRKTHHRHCCCSSFSVAVIRHMLTEITVGRTVYLGYLPRSQLVTEEFRVGPLLLAYPLAGSVSLPKPGPPA